MTFHLAGLFDQGINYRAWVPQLPPYAEQNLQQYMADAGVTTVVISSTLRSPADQARIMLSDIKNYGVDYALNLYDDKTPAQIAAGMLSTQSGDPAILNAMTAYISAHPARVSHHIATGNPDQATCDIEPSTLVGDYGRFIARLEQAYSTGELAKLIVPPKDRAIHLEFVPGKVAQAAQAVVNALNLYGATEGTASVGGVPLWGYLTGAALVGALWYWFRK